MFLGFAQMLRAALTGFYLEQASAQGGFRMRQAEALVHDGAAGADSLLIKLYRLIRLARRLIDLTLPPEDDSPKELL